MVYFFMIMSYTINNKENAVRVLKFKLLSEEANI